MALLIASVVPAAAQQRYDGDCRPLPLPGYMMSPQAQSPECLRDRAQAARAEEANRRQRQAAEERAERERQARAAAAAAAAKERAAVEQAKCEAATAQDVKDTIEQDPVTFGRYAKILDLTEPSFVGNVCRSEAMTSRGIVNVIITFRDFNGKQYINVRVLPHTGS